MRQCYVVSTCETKRDSSLLFLLRQTKTTCPRQQPCLSLSPPFYEYVGIILITSKLSNCGFEHRGWTQELFINHFPVCRESREGKTVVTCDFQHLPDLGRSIITISCPLMSVLYSHTIYPIQPFNDDDGTRLTKLSSFPSLERLHSFFRK